MCFVFFLWKWKYDMIVCYRILEDLKELIIILVVDCKVVIRWFFWIMIIYSEIEWV